MNKVLLLCVYVLISFPMRSANETPRLDLPNSTRVGDEDEEDFPEVIQFFDNPYEGECFVFCCDRSTSMRRAWQGRQKFMHLQQELIKAITQMSSYAEYSIVFFNNALIILSETPIFADPLGRQRGISWIISITTEAGSCLSPGGVKALQIAARSTKQHRTIIILTDGMPYCSGVLTTEMCLQHITRANVQRMPIHTIFIPDDGGHEDPDFLRTLAGLNDGTFKIVGG